MSIQVSCPGCGGPIPFTIGSAVVAVCPYCRSVVARGDRQVEDLGKVADLVETDSPLDVGLKGHYQGVPFELTGRAQLGHAAGGVWDEWYAAFTDGRWGWLAEAQGRFYLTFQQHGPGGAPSYTDLRLGQPLRLASGSAALVVAEKGQARAVSAAGQIPYRLVPDEVYRYADLSGPDGEFATLDYSATPPLVFVGREIGLGELGIPETALRRRREARQVEGVQLSCPHCGGALELRAPDKTQRVTCPSCRSLLDVEQGQLRFFQALALGAKPVIPLGKVGTFEGTPFTVIGFMQRGVVVGGKRYPWEEYLLYQPAQGFRWLVRSDDHWSYVKPLPPGKVQVLARTATVHGNDFKLFQKDNACVDYVLGEFYWKVQVGEHAEAADFIRPPEILSREISQAEGTTEVNWSLGTYLPAAEVEKAFGLAPLPRPALGSVAPNQPFPYKGIYQYWGILTAAAFVIGVILFAAIPRRKVFDESFHFEPATSAEHTQTVFTKPFELRGRRNVHVTVRAPQVDNSWLYVEGDFINEDTNLLQPFAAEVAYYHGSEGGESWTEGSQQAGVYLSSLPAGTYRLRLEAQWEKHQQPVSAEVIVEQGRARVLYWVLTLAALAVVPLIVLVYHFFFEKRRWEDSPFSPYASSS